MAKQILIEKPGRYLSISGLLISALLVSSCGVGNIPYFPSKYDIKPQTEVIAVENGSISVPPPNGFCKDASGSKNTETAAILIFANCDYLKSNGRRASAEAGFSGLVTTSISKSIAFQNGDGVDTVADFLGSKEGLEALSSSGQSETVSIIDEQRSTDGIYIQLHDKDAVLSPNVWKSFLNRSDHLVTVTLLQNEKSSLSAEQAMTFLQSYSESIKLSTAPVMRTGKTRPVAISDPVDQPTLLKKVGFLRRLLF